METVTVTVTSTEAVTEAESEAVDVCQRHREKERERDAARARDRALANIYVPQMSTVNVNLYYAAATLRICQRRTYVSQNREQTTLQYPTRKGMRIL